MNTNLTTQESKSNSELQTTFSNETVNLIKNTVAPKDLTPKEFEMFIYQANRTGLDPLSRQIYCIKNRDKVSIQATIDGFRLIAERTGDYQGQTPVMWCGNDGVWADVWTKKEYPAAAKVGVYRKNFTEPLYAVARFETYVQKYGDKLNYNWAKMPDLMIGKCAEALALRKAFPQELSNIYSDDEMATFNDEHKTVKTVSDPAKPSFSERAINYMNTLKDGKSLKETYEKTTTAETYKSLSKDEQEKIDKTYLDCLMLIETPETAKEKIEEVFGEVEEVKTLPADKRSGELNGDMANEFNNVFDPVNEPIYKNAKTKSKK